MNWGELVLRIGKMTDYGVLVLNKMVDAGAVRLSTEDLVQATKLAVPTIRRVMKALSDGGLVIAQRGAKGGYRLARAAEQIRIIDVVQAFEGPVSLTECTSDDAQCEIMDSCSLSGNWNGINQLLVQVLSSISLQDLRNPKRQEQLIQSTAQMKSYIELISVG